MILGRLRAFSICRLFKEEKVLSDDKSDSELLCDHCSVALIPKICFDIDIDILIFKNFDIDIDNIKLINLTLILISILIFYILIT